MKKFALSAVILLCNVVLFAQVKTFDVGAGENPAVVLPQSIRMLNPAYEDGFLTLASGNKTKTAKFNIDLYKGLITFISEKKDTSIIVDDQNVKRVRIGSSDYNHIQKMGYLKVLSSDSMHMLSSLTTLIGNLIKKVDEGYGKVSTTSVTSGIGTATTRNDRRYVRKTEYFLQDIQGSAVPANKGGFYKMFSSTSDQVKAFVKQEHIDFEKEEELVKLFNYCISLTAGGKG